MAKQMDQETLEYIMRSITTRDRKLQRHIADTYLTEDVKLTHVLGDAQGREAMYGVYRAAVTGIDYKLKMIDVFMSEGKAAFWVDLNIKLAPFYIKRYHAPTIVMLRWKRCADGLYRITEQIDHHSMFVFMWAFGWPLSALFDMVTRQVTGRLLTLSGWGVDVVEDVAAACFNLSSQTLGWCLANTLPEPALQGLASILPLQLSKAMGLPRHMHAL